MTSTVAYTPQLGEDCSSAAIVPVPHCEYHLDDFGPLTTPEQVVATLVAAATYVGGQGGGVICCPPGDLTMTAFPDTAVGTDEGAGLVLTEAMSNITFRGSRTTLKPASNRIEMFVILGAENTAFEGFIFDNSDNGRLNNELKPLTKIPGGGVVGLGNAANAAIRQYSGAGLTVRNCYGIAFHTIVDYAGDYLDVDVLSWDAIVDGLHTDGCVMGFLVGRAKTIRYVDSSYVNGLTADNAEGSPQNHDPGHGIYVARGGAHPDNVLVADINGYNNESYTVQIRRGKTVTVDNIVVHASHRGVVLENCQILAVSNLAIDLAILNPDDGQADGLRVKSCGNYEIDGVVINVTGTEAAAVRVTSSPFVTDDPFDNHDGDDESDLSWNNRRGRIRGLKIIDDVTVEHDKNWIMIEEQIDLVLEEPIAHLTTINFPSSRAMITLDTCTRVRIIRPQRRTAEAGVASDGERLVTVAADCVDCYIKVDRQCIDTDSSASTILNLSTTTKVDWLDDGEPSVRASDYEVVPRFRSYINDKDSADQVVTLPDPALYKSLVLYFQTWRAFATLSLTANVGTLGTGVATTQIVPATIGKWAKLRSDGTLWQIEQAG